jgi:hypothetical protein
MEGTTSSPVTHNVYTTGSGEGAGGGGGMSGMIPALLAMGMHGMNGNQGNQGQQHHYHHGQQTGQDSSTSHALTAAAAGLAGRGNGGWGAGGGGAAVGGVIGFVLGALLNSGGNGGIFGGGNRNDGTGNLVTTTELNTALNAQTANSNTNAILQQLAAIAVAIPENEGKVQLALAQSQIALSNQAAQGQLQAANNTYLLTNNVADARHQINDNIHAIALNDANQFAAVNSNIANVNTIAQQLAAGLGLQAANNTSAILTAIRNDGDQTRALVTAFNDATLNRIITTQANEIIELRSERTVRGNGVEVSQVVNQVSAQNQAQAQAQAQFQLLSGISAQLAGIHQIANATNQNIIAGNTGAVTTAAQTASPTNVNTR